MTEQEKINGWTFEETVKTAENLMEVEKNMFKWDVLRHLRDFAENFKEELKQYRAIGTPDEFRAAVENQKEIKNNVVDDFVERAMKQFTDFDLKHGYPTVTDCKVILRDIAEQMKGSADNEQID